jgi:RNA-binding protein with serine-rich domain 1
MNRACKVSLSTYIMSLLIRVPVMTNRGTAYILYYDAADAESAISHMHEAQLDGAVLNVSIVLPRRTFSRSPPPIRQSRADIGHSTYGRAHAMDNGRVASGSHRASPPRRISPPRRYGVHRMTERHDIYRPRSRSRSRSPRRSRPYSPRSVSRSPSRREHLRRESPRRRRRRSPSYSSYSSANSYSSFSDRSRSPSRN